MSTEVSVEVPGPLSASAVTPVDPVGRVAGARSRGQRGAVTAEAAVVLPLLVAVALGLVWAVALATTQVRVVDAAREVARSAARGESVGVATARGRVVAPSGTRFEVVRDDDEVRVRAVAEVDGPGGLFRFLPGVDVSAVTVAVREPR